jgi:regulatory protein
LLKNKFLDDQRFAEHYIRNQTNIKPTGRYKLAIKLKQNLIDDDIIQKVLAEITDENEIDSAKELARKKYEILIIKHPDDKNKIREKLFRHLITRGFSYEITKSVIDDLIK